MKFYDDLLKEIEIQYGSIYVLCKSTGMSHSTFSRIKKLGHSSCSNKTLSLLSKYLHLDLEELKKGNIVELGHEHFEHARIIPTEPVPSPLTADIMRRLDKLSLEGKFRVLQYIDDISAKFPAN